MLSETDSVCPSGFVPERMTVKEAIESQDVDVRRAVTVAVQQELSEAVTQFIEQWTAQAMQAPFTFYRARMH